ncbi:hypothetical protein ACMGGD_16285 [Pseudomonas sp. BNK-6]|uniref:hypothetical protein n=1 Tax=unclassified Pseudomonas TaxID=196821 RepID=UPI001A9F8868|nr:hypothetical protein [Pseudomonas sp. 50_B]
MSEGTSGGSSPEGLPGSFQPPSSQSQSPLLDPNIASEAQAFADNEDQAKSEFRPPPPPLESPLLDPTIVGEIQAFANNEDQDQAQKRKQDNEIHGLRMVHAWLLFGLTIIWVYVIWIVILLQGFGRWFVPMMPGFKPLHFEISDSVLIAFMTTTTATVLGLYGIAAYWLYGKPKQEGKNTSKDKKRPS